VSPADGATHVPTNAKVWIFGAEQNAYLLNDGVNERVLGSASWTSPKIVQLDTRTDVRTCCGLLANHKYTVKTVAGEHVTTFTTGDEIDSTPPDPPTINSVRYESGRLSVAAVSKGSVAVWVTTSGDADRWAWQLFPAEGFEMAFATCHQFDVHAPNAGCVELSSVDLAGNLSKTVSNCNPILGGPFLLSNHRQQPDDRSIKLVLIALGIVATLDLLLLRRRLATQRLREALKGPRAHLVADAGRPRR